MKIFLLLFVLAVGCSAQDKWKSTCDSNPEYCSKAITPLTAEEKLAVEDARKKYDADQKEVIKSSKYEDDLFQRIVKAHKMEKFPAFIASDGEFGGGTCTGQVELVDGYIVYTPSEDIRSCGDYEKR